MPISNLQIRKVPKIVVIGGGTGTSVVLGGLKRFDVDLTAIVTAFDSGGSSGRLREEFGHLSLGDIRRCLIALSEESEETEAFRLATEYRFSDDSSMNGHNLGNLFLSALTVMHNDIEHAVYLMSQMLRIKGKVLPVSLEPADLCAELIDGSVLRGEATIDLRQIKPPAIQRVYLDAGVKANKRAIEAICEADVVVLGPGDLYTSIIPNLLVDGVVDAIKNSEAKTIYVCNLMTKHGETDGFGPADFVREINAYLGDTRVDTVLVNNQSVTSDIKAVYASVKAVQVSTKDHRSQMAPWSNSQVYAPLSETIDGQDDGKPRVRHDPARLADEILKTIKFAGIRYPYTETGAYVSHAAD